MELGRGWSPGGAEGDGEKEAQGVLALHNS